MKSNDDLKKLYEKQSINGESNIPHIAYESGEEVWRNITPLITIKDPLFNIKSISKIVFDKNIYDIAYSYLGEKPKFGFVKIKNLIKLIIIVIIKFIIEMIIVKKSSNY